MSRQFAELTGLVVSAAHRSERDADRTAQRAVRQAGRGPVHTRPRGGRLDGDTWRRMERAFGTDLSAVQVHVSSDVDEVSDLLRAHAFAIGRDVYVRRADYRPGTRAGDELLAHELAHTVQRGPAGQISLKRRKMHLDFVRMKRAKIEFGRIIRKKLGLTVPAQEPAHGTWGHFWTEVGKLDRVNPKQPRWRPEASYGWYPKGAVAGPLGALRGVPGKLNHGEQNDPHHGDVAPVEFHPVMDVDTDADYAQVRRHVTQQIHQFATSFKGSWNWRLGWGKNCQTFQRALKKNVGLHYTTSKYWLNQPGQATMGETLMVRNLLYVYPQLPEGPGAVEFLDSSTQVGVTGLTTRHRWPDGADEDLGEVLWIREGQRFWVRPADFEKEFGRPYPAAQRGEAGAPDVERGREAVSDSL
jgi:hypothetical protein